MTELNIMDFGIRLLIGMFLGAMIGIERHWRQRSAGLRTNTLVSIGATTFILLSLEIGGDSTGRIASYIISGIGFLGAGVIMKDGLNISGLNTAATIWCSAAVGSLCGMGKFSQAFMVTLVIMLTHLILRPVGIWVNRISFISSSNAPTEYLFTIKCKEEVETEVRVLLIQMLKDQKKTFLHSLSSHDSDDYQKTIITAEIKTLTPQDVFMEKIVNRFSTEEKVSSISWQIIGTESVMS